MRQAGTTNFCYAAMGAYQLLQQLLKNIMVQVGQKDSFIKHSKTQVAWVLDSPLVTASVIVVGGDTPGPSPMGETEEL